MSEDRNVREERGRWRYDRSRNPGRFWGLILIVLGIVFFLHTQGWLPRGEWWQYFLIGLGLIFLIESLVRYSGRESHRPGLGRAAAGLILIFIGAAFLLGFGNWWPLILIVVGLAVLLNVWSRR